MKKILGLDLGVASVGWSVILIDDEGNGDVLGMGTRVVPLDADEKKTFTEGKPVPTNVARRMKRGIRRSIQRFNLRKNALRKVLSPLGMLPDESLFQLTAVELYGLRDRALREQLSLPEIGRILFHINGKRGFKSNRKAPSAEELNDAPSDAPSKAPDGKPKKEGYLDKIKNLSEQIKASGLTVGQYFYEALKVDNQYEVKKKILYRADYMAEFDRIWSTQAAYYPEVMTEDLLRRVRDGIIYHQRPLKSQKQLVNKCRFEDNCKVAPISSPLAELCRIWEAVNNLEYKDKFNKPAAPLTLKEREAIVELLHQKEKVSAKDIDKICKRGAAETLNYEELKGHKTYLGLLKAFDKIGVSKAKSAELLAFNPLAADLEKEPLYALWHLLYATEEELPVIKTLVNKFGLEAGQAEYLAKKIAYNAERCGKSTKAMRNIMPFLLKGMKYYNACVAYAQVLGAEHRRYAAYNNASNSETLDEKLSRQLADALKPIRKGELRSPVTEKILNQMINLVNTLLEEYKNADGSPTFDEIHVELARELKEPAKKRQDMTKNLAKTDKLYRDYEKELLANSELNLKRVTKKDLIKYRLWKETNGVYMYDPSKIIELNDLFSANCPYEIEHIIPRSRLFDDSFANKTLALRKDNQDKDNTTARDYMEGRGNAIYNDYIGLVNQLKATKAIGYQKYTYLTMKGSDIPKEFLNRDLALTRYITREASQRLRSICREVQVCSGTVTAVLRELWGLDEMLLRLNMPKLERLGLLEEVTDVKGNKHLRPCKEHPNPDATEADKKKFKPWTKRDDQRHHALDALVTACTSRSHVKYFNDLNQTYEERKAQNLKTNYVEMPFPHFQATVREALEGVLVSYKAGKKSVAKARKHKEATKAETHLIPRGRLHEETIYGRIKRIEKVLITPKFNPDKYDGFIHEAQAAAVRERWEGHNKKPAKAFAEPVRLPNGKVLQSVIMYNWQYTTSKDLNINFDPKQVAKIIDPNIQRIVEEHLHNYGGDPKKAFAEGITVWQNKAKGIAIKKVIVEALISNPIALRQDKNGEPYQFVEPGSNHHTAVYRDAEGKLKAEVVSFWTAVERRRQGHPAVALSHSEYGDLQFYFQENDMFIFGLSREELEDAIDKNNRQLLNKHLYRVQKMTNGAYYFRHHLETSVTGVNFSEDNDNTEDNPNRRFAQVVVPRIFYNIGAAEKIGIKVRINAIGKISLA